MMDFQPPRPPWNWTARLLRLNALAVYIFLYAPIVVLIGFSFSASRYSAVWGGFSTRWYEKLFSNVELRTALGQTLLLAGSSTLCATVLGTLAALGLAKLSRRLQGPLETAFYLPVIMPDIVLAISLLVFFKTLMPAALGLPAMILSHIAFNLCYVAAVVGTSLKGFNPRLEEASLDLGATPWQTFVRIKLPLIWPGILGGALLATALSLDEFVIAFFVSAADSTTLPLQIYAMLKRGVTPEINALASLMLTASILLACLSLFLQKKYP
ncbi:MAG: ABC transporter permease [Candidatus Methylacidiphilales bacterium]|nr:ABC transporter permease [Candidatus Methylacidiphilales bacterium]